MDEIARYNRERWNSLVQAQAIFTKPYLHLSAEEAQSYLDPKGLLGDIKGKRVLCLASGGGQQSVAFALLGASVTVIDLSEAQLQRDQEAAEKYGLLIQVQQSDMRDLSCLEGASFDIVYQPYSINFVPEAKSVFQEVARVLRSQGLYHFMCANPLVLGLNPEDWEGTGYPLRLPYVSGGVVSLADEDWVFGQAPKPATEILWRREYRHTFSDLVNGLVESELEIYRLYEEHFGEADFSQPAGTPQHFTAVAPPWLIFWAVRK